MFFLHVLLPSQSFQHCPTLCFVFEIHFHNTFSSLARLRLLALQFQSTHQNWKNTLQQISILKSTNNKKNISRLYFPALNKHKLGSNSPHPFMADILAFLHSWIFCFRVQFLHMWLCQQSELQKLPHLIPQPQQLLPTPNPAQQGSSSTMVLDKNEGGAEVSKPGSSASDPNAQQAATSRHTFPQLTSLLGLLLVTLCP